MTKEAKLKTKFRQSSKWKNFRKYMKKRQGVDFVTQKPLLSGFQLHHEDMSAENYENLNPDNFVCLNRTTHKVCHWLFRYTNWREILSNLYIILEKMERLNKQ